MRVARLILAATLAVFIASCGGGGGGGSTNPAPSPSSIPLADVAYVPFADAIEVFAFSSSTFATPLSLPAAATPLGDLALDATGSTIYYDVDENGSESLIAQSVSSGGGTIAGTLDLSNAPVSTSFVPLANGNVAVFTTPASASQNIAVYSSFLRTAVLQPTPSTTYTSPVPATGAAFFAVDPNGYIDKVTTPSLDVIASSRSTGFVTTQPIALDQSTAKLCATTYDVASNATTLFALDPVSLNATALVRIPGNARLYAASGGRAVLGAGVTFPRLYVVSEADDSVTPIDLSSQAGTLETVGLRSNGSSVIAAMNDNSGSAKLLVFDASTGALTASLSRPHPVNGQIVTH